MAHGRERKPFDAIIPVPPMEEEPDYSGWEGLPPEEVFDKQMAAIDEVLKDVQSHEGEVGHLQWKVELEGGLKTIKDSVAAEGLPEGERLEAVTMSDLAKPEEWMNRDNLMDDANYFLGKFRAGRVDSLVRIIKSRVAEGKSPLADQGHDESIELATQIPGVWLDLMYGHVSASGEIKHIKPGLIIDPYLRGPRPA